YDSATHSFTFDPANAAYAYLAAGQQTTVTVTYNVSDGTDSTPASVSWVVTGTADGPEIVASTPAHLVEATLGNPGANPPESHLTLSGGTYDTAALLADGWESGGNGNYTKAGAYGTVALNVNTNTVSYILDNQKADKLGAGDTPTETFTIPVV